MGFRTRMVRNLFLVALLASTSSPALANSPRTATFEPFLGYEAGTKKTGLFIPGFIFLKEQKSVSGFSGGVRIGTKREKGFWGFGAEVGSASVGGRNQSYVKPFDLGVYLTHYWRGGFRMRASGIPYTTAGEVQGMAFKLALGFLVSENISINLDYIYRNYTKLTTDVLPGVTFNGKLVTGMLSVGFPFGEKNLWRKSGQDSY